MLAGQIIQPSITILRYHSIQEAPEEFADSIGLGIFHSKNDFKEQMELVARWFTLVTFIFIKREKRIPRKAVAVKHL
jgi:hypothetical protein